ncbi:MAG: hypothetical protein A2Z51_09510 [Deltaproteobacteria bacterium RBG_19FT_COMBO_52_11]|nr:MAG: hypothetical protein A2Z51_09510 [Deltaproteobacteria bacterium RBG_19FT_COMBO_52_11]
MSSWEPWTARGKNIYFPTVGSLDGKFRQRLEDLGMGYEKEVEMIRRARGLGLFTTCYCFNPEGARTVV